MKKRISKELLKGSLKPIILKLLKEHGKMYGYEITRKVDKISQGRINLTFGALYPILHKLENEGIVFTEKENVNNRIRVYYNLTDKGKTRTTEIIDELEDFIVTLKIFLTPNLSTGICTT